jgi:prefoldin subunit 5
MANYVSRRDEEFEALQEENERLKGEIEMLRGDIVTLRRVIKALPNPMDIVRLRRLLED